jgi:hypothetical protein
MMSKEQWAMIPAGRKALALVKLLEKRAKHDTDSAALVRTVLDGKLAALDVVLEEVAQLRGVTNDLQVEMDYRTCSACEEDGLERCLDHREMVEVLTCESQHACERSKPLKDACLVCRAHWRIGLLRLGRKDGGA